MKDSIRVKDILIKISKDISGLSQKVEKNVRREMLYQRLDELFRGKDKWNKLKAIIKIWTA